MNDKYYIEQQARRIRKCLYPGNLPFGKVCPEYLKGLDENLFMKAVNELRDIFMDYYIKAEEEPESLNMPLIERDKFRSTSNEARSGNAALLNFPVALFALAIGLSKSSGSSAISIAIMKDFYKENKCKRLTEQLNLLMEYGFGFDGFDGKKLPKGDVLVVDYPDNPDVLHVLSVLGDKLSKYTVWHLQQPKFGGGITMLEQFVYLTPGVFADNTEQLPPKTLEHMASAIGEEYKDVFETIVDRFDKRGMVLTFDTLFLKNRFMNAKGKDSLCFIECCDYKSIWQDANENLYLRLKLNNPGAYSDKIKALPPHLYSAFTDVWCGNCSETCNRKIKYQFDGEEKCACGCFFFAYRNPKAEDIDKLMELYDFDLESRAKKK